jgi:hypothetical protein
MILHGILSSNESVTVLWDLIMDSKIKHFDKGFVKEIVNDIKYANDKKDILVNIRWVSCNKCDFVTMSKQALSCHDGKSHTNPKMMKALSLHEKERLR